MTDTPPTAIISPAASGRPASARKPASAKWRVLAGIVAFVSPKRGGLLLFVVLPTLLAVLYQGGIASDIYISESAYSVRNDTGQAAAMTSLLPGLMGGGGAHDQLTVNTYIQSRAMMDALMKRLDLKAIYRHPAADLLSRLRDDTTHEDMLDYYRTMLTITQDEHSGIATLHVRAFSAAEAQALNQAILELAEIFVNKMSDRMRADSIVFAQKQLAKAEREAMALSEKINQFRQEHRDLNPLQTSQAVAGIVQSIEARRAELRAKLDTARGMFTSNNPHIRTMERELAALDREAEKQTAKLVDGEKNTMLASQMEAYGALLLQQEFAAKRYSTMLTALEAAQTQASRKSIYLTRVVEPSLPDLALEPHRLRIIATVLVLSLVSYSLMLLIGAAIGDHIRR